MCKVLFLILKGTINPSDKIRKEYSFDGVNKIDIKLLDALTKEKIDSAVVIQDNSRNLNGLF